MPVYLRGKIPAHPLQGPTLRRVRLELRLSLSDLADLLGVGRRHVKRLQANQRCASGRLAGRFAYVTGELLPMPTRVLPRLLPPPSRDQRREARRAEALERPRFQWDSESLYGSLYFRRRF